MGLAFFKGIKFSCRVNDIFSSNGFPIQVGWVTTIKNMDFVSIEHKISVFRRFHLSKILITCFSMDKKVMSVTLLWLLRKNSMIGLFLTEKHEYICSSIFLRQSARSLMTEWAFINYGNPILSNQSAHSGPSCHPIWYHCPYHSIKRYLRWNFHSSMTNVTRGSGSFDHCVEFWYQYKCQIIYGDWKIIFYIISVISCIIDLQSTLIKFDLNQTQFRCICISMLQLPLLFYQDP